MPPASIAKLAAVSTAPETAVTLPGVTSFRLVTLAEAKVVLASIEMFPAVALPNCKVVAFKNVLAAAGSDKAEVEATPSTMFRPEVRGEISTRLELVAETFALRLMVSETIEILLPEPVEVTAELIETLPPRSVMSPASTLSPLM